MAQKPIPGTRSEEEVIARYPSLNIHFRRDLTDFYNHFLGLNMYAYGNEDQREYVRGRIEERVDEGKSPFTTYGARVKLDKRIPASVTNGDGEFHQEDLDHMNELNSLVEFLNGRGRDLQVDEAREAYNLLIAYLYGRKEQR